MSVGERVEAGIERIMANGKVLCTCGHPEHKHGLIGCSVVTRTPYGKVWCKCGWYRPIEPSQPSPLKSSESPDDRSVAA